jgi:hypothetical protein
MRLLISTPAAAPASAVPPAISGPFAFEAAVAIELPVDFVWSIAASVSDCGLGRLRGFDREVELVRFELELEVFRFDAELLLAVEPLAREPLRLVVFFVVVLVVCAIFVSLSCTRCQLFGRALCAQQAVDENPRHPAGHNSGGRRPRRTEAVALGPFERGLS